MVNNETTSHPRISAKHISTFSLILVIAVLPIALLAEGKILNIVGIALQLAAGFCFIFVQAFSKEAEHTNKKLTDYINSLREDPNRRQKVYRLAAVFILASAIALTFMFSNGEPVTWPIIFGAFFGFAMFLVIGYKSYHFLLVKLGKCKLIKRNKLFINNVILLLIFLAILWSFLDVYSLYSSSSQNIAHQILMLLYIFSYMLIAIPVFLISLSYLLATGFLHSPRVPTWARQTTMLAIWTSGGTLLLINICSS